MTAIATTPAYTDAVPRDGDQARRCGYALTQNPFAKDSAAAREWASDWGFRDTCQPRLSTYGHGRSA